MRTAAREDPTDYYPKTQLNDALTASSGLLEKKTATPVWTAVSEIVRPVTNESLIAHIEVDNSVDCVSPILPCIQPDRFAQDNRFDLWGIIVGFYTLIPGMWVRPCYVTA